MTVLGKRAGLWCRTMSAVLLAAALALPFAAPTVAQQRGGRINVALTPEPPTLLLGLNSQGPVQLVGSKIYDALLTYSPDLKPVPSLAKSWEVAADGLTYTFHLQENVKWHDGAPFSSADVVFSLRDLLSQTNTRTRILTGVIASYETPDANTVVFKLKQPFPAFLLGFDVTNVPIMPRHLYEGTDFRNNPNNARPIGTGPFKFAEWRKGEFIRLVRNENYWKPGKPYLDEILFRIVPDATARLAALESGEIDVASNYDIDPVQTPLLKQNPNLEVTSKGYEFQAQLSVLDLNNRVKPLDDPRFRRAILHALDRDFIAQRIWFGIAAPATGPFNSATKYFEPNTPRYEFSPDKAKALLDEMGLKPDGAGVRARLRLMGSPNGEVYTRMAEYIREALGKVGIEVRIESVDAGTWAQRLGNWDFDMTISTIGQYADPAIGIARTYISSNIRKVPFTNTAGYNNPKVDELFEQAGKTMDEGERARLYSEAQKIIVADAPLAWLLQVSFPTVLNRRFADVVTTALGTNENFDAVYLRK